MTGFPSHFPSHLRRGLLVLLVLLLGAACAPGAGPPMAASLEELTSQQESWNGRHVTTQGVLRSFDDPLHYWIEDDDLHRVELVPHEELDLLLGREVRVVGRFTFDDTRGRQIEIDQLDPVPVE